MHIEEALNALHFEFKQKTAQFERMSANFTYLLNKFDELHTALNLPVKGGWQNQVEQVVETIKKQQQNNK